MSTYSTLKIELITTGDQVGTWGNTTNTNLGTALEEAIVGRATATFTSDANLTISLTNTNASQVARNYVLNVVSSGSLTATRDLIVPSIEKPYIVENNTSGGQSIRVKTAAGTGVTIPNGKKALVYSNATNVVAPISYIPDLEVDTLDATTITIDSITVAKEIVIGSSSGLTGTYSQTATTVTVTATAHGYTAGQYVYIEITSGDALSGYYAVSATGLTTNSFQYTAATSLSTTGNVTVKGTVVFYNMPIIYTPLAVNTTSKMAGLRVTQLGTGNTMEAYDQGSDTTPFVINASGQTLVGYGTARANFNNSTISPQFQIEGLTNNTSSAAIIRNSNDDVQPVFYFGKTRGTANGATTVVTSGDTLGAFLFQGMDGTQFVNGATILAQVDTNPGADDMPGRLVFATTANGGTSSIERMRISSTGLTSIGYSSATGAALTATTPAKLYSVGNTYTDSSTTGGGTAAFGMFHTIGTPALAASNTFVTYTRVANFYLGGAPTAGTNVTITNPAYTMYINSGTNYWGSGTNLIGVDLSRTFDFAATTDIPKLQIEDTTSAAALSITKNVVSVTDAGALIIAKTRGANSSFTTVVNGDTLGYLSFEGADGAQMLEAAYVTAAVDGTVNGTSHYMPGRLSFSTTALTASTPTERVRIGSNGLTTVAYSAGAGAALTTSAPAKFYSANTGYTDTVTGATGTVAHGVINSFDSTAIAASNVSVTYTRASSMYIAGAPSNGTNVTITNPYALYINGGNNYFGTGTATFGSTSIPLSTFSNSTYAPQIQNIGSTTADSSLGIAIFNATAGTGSIFEMARSKSGTVGTYTALTTDDAIGQIVFSGADGTDFSQAAAIYGVADGEFNTSSDTTDSPGRLVFLTTPDGSATLTERMRINNAGQISFGGAPVATTLFAIKDTVTVTGATIGADLYGTLSSTSATYGIYSNWRFAASLGAVTSHTSIIAGPPTLGSGTTVSTVYGVNIPSSVNNGTTNNFGLYANIAQTSATVALSNVSRTSNVVTVITGSAHGYVTGQTVAISISTPAASQVLNGTFTITVTGTTTFTYSLYGTDVAGVSTTGTATAIKNYNIYSNGTAYNYFAGAVGIGTNSPDYPLDIASAGSTIVRIGAANTTSTSSDYDATLLLNATSQGESVVYFARNNDSALNSGTTWSAIWRDGTSSDLRFATNGTTALTIDSSQNVGLGTTSPTAKLNLSGSMSQTVSTTGSISGATLTVSSGTSIAIGQLVFGAGVEPNTYITAGSGTSWTVNNSQTVTSTTLYFVTGTTNLIRFTDTDTDVVANQPLGRLEWYGSDASTPTAGVKGYVSVVNESITPDTAMVFGTSDNVASTQAVERLRIASRGWLQGSIGSTPTGQYQASQVFRLNSGLAGANVNTAQKIFGVGVTLAASTVYEFEAVVALTKTAGSNGHTIGLSFGGTATINNISYAATVRQVDNSTDLSTPDNDWTWALFIPTATNETVSYNNGGYTSQAKMIVIRGTVSVNAGGTFIPQYTCSAAPGGAYTTSAGSFFRIAPLSDGNANTSIGDWA